MDDLILLVSDLAEVRAALARKREQLAALTTEVRGLSERHEQLRGLVAKAVEKIDCRSTGNWGWDHRIPEMLADLWSAKGN